MKYLLMIYENEKRWAKGYDKDEMAEYLASIEHSMPPAPVIDFNAPEYTSFRSDPSNYIDDIHLSEKGAKTLSLLLNDKMHQMLNPK